MRGILRDGSARIPLIALGVCLAATLGAASLAEDLARSAAQRAFESSAGPIVRSVESALRTYAALTGVSSVLFDTTPAQTRSLAGRYMIADTLAEAFPAAVLFAFVRRVPDAELGRYRPPRSASLQADENGLLAFSARPAAGSRVHLLLEQMFPDTALPGMLGEDLSADPVTAAAFERAQNLRSVVAITRTSSTLVADGVPVLVAPVYDPLTAPRDRSLPSGFIVVKANIGSMLTNALAGRAPAGYAVRVGWLPDRTSPSPDPDGESQLFAFSNYDSGAESAANTRALHTRHEIDLGADRVFVDVSSPASGVVNSLSYFPLFVGASGVVVSLLVWFAAASLTGTSRRALSLAHKMTAAARHSDQRFRSIVESSRDWIWELDADGRFNYSSPNCRALLGYGPEEMVGKRVGEIVQPNPGEPEGSIWTHDEIPAAFQARMRTVRRKDGELRIMESTGAPFFDSDGRFAGVRGIDRDVTTRIRLRDRLAELQIELETAGHFNLAGQLLAGMAHELNQPLSAISLYSQSCIRLIESGSTDRAEILRFMRSAAASAAQAGEIIRRLRKFMAKREVRVAVVRIGDPVEDALALVEAHLAGLKITVDADLAADLPPVQVDTVLMLQVMLNLISNAADAMRDAPRRVLEISARKSPDGRVEITFADSGAGVPAAAAERLFDWYFTTKHQGMGLGLAISRSIVEAHEGTLTYAARPQGGAAFTISLPATKEEIRRETALN